MTGTTQAKSELHAQADNNERCFLPMEMNPSSLIQPMFLAPK
jgi:hypothetical protein